MSQGPACSFMDENVDQQITNANISGISDVGGLEKTPNPRKLENEGNIEEKTNLSSAPMEIEKVEMPNRPQMSEEVQQPYQAEISQNIANSKMDEEMTDEQFQVQADNISKRFNLPITDNRVNCLSKN